MPSFWDGMLVLIGIDVLSLLGLFAITALCYRRRLVPPGEEAEPGWRGLAGCGVLLLLVTGLGYAGLWWLVNSLG